MNPQMRSVATACTAAMLGAIVTGGCSKACITTEEAVVHDPSGLTFTVKSTSCDTLGNDVATSIYASDSSGSSPQSIMKYGPDDRSSLPRITLAGQTITIAIDSVAEVITQEHRFHGYDVSYKIAHVEYPSRTRTKAP